MQQTANKQVDKSAMKEISRERDGVTEAGVDKEGLPEEVTVE